MKRLGRPPKVPRDPERDELRAQIRARLEPLLQELGDRIADLMAPRVLELRASAEVERAHFLSDAIDRELAGDVAPDPETKSEEPDGGEGEGEGTEDKEASDASDDAPSDGDEDRRAVPARDGRPRGGRAQLPAASQPDRRDRIGARAAAAVDQPRTAAASPATGRRPPTVAGGQVTCSKCGRKGHNARTCGKSAAADEDEGVRLARDVAASDVISTARAIAARTEVVLHQDEVVAAILQDRIDRADEDHVPRLDVAVDDAPSIKDLVVAGRARRRALDSEPPPPSSAASSLRRRAKHEAANIPPPGWTPQLDRQEEVEDLNWLHMRRP